MSGLFDELDIRILECLSKVGPRNLSRLARMIGVPRKTIEFRIKRMRSDPKFFLRIHTSVYHTNLGLKKAIVIAEARPAMEQLLYECLLTNDFWLYVCRSYGTGEGCTAIYAIPVENCEKFEQFINEIKQLGVAVNTQIYWSTCFQGGRITSEWFDSCKKEWIFRWDDWVKDVQMESTDLPYTLIEPDSYTNYADEIDIKMLEKLEADATRSLSKIAKSLGISRQLAKYHYEKHLIGRNLIEGYEVFVMRYGTYPSFMVLFIIFFPSYENFAKFARSLLNKFFVITMGKILGKNGLLVEVFLPVEEFRRFVDALSELAKINFVQSYRYVIQDLRIRRRQTIWPRLFSNNSWIYDHEKYVNRLRQKVSEFLSSRENL